MTQKKGRDRQIERALLILGPPIQGTLITVDWARRKRSIDTIVDLLKLPRKEDWTGWNDISNRVDLMVYLASRFGDRDQVQPRKTAIDQYVAVLQSLQLVTPRIIAHGLRPLMAQDAVDHMVEFAKRNLCATAMPWFLRQVAVEQAYELLQIWAHPVTVSQVSTWHRVAAELYRVAATLLGVESKPVLTRRMRNFLKSVGTAGVVRSISYSLA
jgi:hypothetical protein